jgi:phosphoribosylformylglycinamidine cyclo-ligase
VERDRVIDGATLVPGDVLIGLPSSGLHTNGYSLARRIVFDELKLDVDSHVAELGTTVGDALLAPHRSYLQVVEAIVRRQLAKGLAHITGGGITENLPRIFPEGVGAAIERAAWDVPPLFSFLQQAGGVPEQEMFRAFNMGIGMIVACDARYSSEVLAMVREAGAPGAQVIGGLVSGESIVTYV